MRTLPCPSVLPMLSNLNLLLALNFQPPHSLFSWQDFILALPDSAAFDTDDYHSVSGMLLHSAALTPSLPSCLSLPVPLCLLIQYLLVCSWHCNPLLGDHAPFPWLQEPSECCSSSSLSTCLLPSCLLPSSSSAWMSQCYCKLNQAKAEPPCKLVLFCVSHHGEWHHHPLSRLA